MQDQYALIHDAVLQALVCGDTQIPASDLHRALDNLKRPRKNLDGKSALDEQLQVAIIVNPHCACLHNRLYQM